MKRKIGLIIVAALAMVGAVVCVPGRADAEAACKLVSKASSDDGNEVEYTTEGQEKCAALLKNSGLTCEAGEDCNKKIRAKIDKDKDMADYYETFVSRVETIMTKDIQTGYNTGKCTSILPDLCNESDGSGIMHLVRFIISILTGAVVVAGTIGIIICGVMIVTARDDEQQLTKAKKRLLDIVIGIIAWAMIAIIMNLFIPKQTDEIKNDVNQSLVIDGAKG